MRQRSTKLITLFLIASLLLTSCSAGVFQGQRGVQLAAQEMAPKPPLEITSNNKPLPGVAAKQYNPPRPPIQPFSVSRTLYPQVAAANGLGALLLPPAPDYIAPLAAPIGPAFNWSQTDNYLLLGTDHRPGWTSWRTDVLMIVGVDRANARVAVFSVPRDLYVQIPGYGWGRINQVDYIGEKASPGGGGPALVSQVLASTLGISTNHWVRIRMDGFIDVVNAVGGVSVHLDCPFYEPIFNLTTNAWDYFALPAGDVWLDGDTAYWFVRLRYRESDIGRNQRQREFLWGLRNQMVRTNLLANFPQLYGAFQSMVATDLNPLEIVDMLSWGIQLDPASVRASGLTLYDLQSYTTPEGASVLRIADPNRVRGVVEGIWAAPAMVDSYRKDVTRCPALPPGVTYATDTLPDLSSVNVEAAGEAPSGAEAQPPAPEAPAAEAPATEAPADVAAQPTPEAGLALPEPTPTPAESVSTSLFPTPTPAPISLLPPAPEGG
ncbi:MAG TPA: LCP family protein [Caldilinea sp.]|nr:LCP family protein [Caldilinea sp.]